MAADERIRVAVNGYGVIGKRVADAVTLQEDMRLAGIADIVFDYRTRVAVERGYPVYAAMPERRGEMAAAGIPVAGTLDDLLRQADVVVDCTPKRIAGQTGTATARPTRASGRWASRARRSPPSRWAAGFRWGGGRREPCCAR